MNDNNKKRITIDEAQEVIFEYENYKNILYGLNIAKSLELLPDDTDKFLEKINKTIPDDFAGACEKLIELSETNPIFFNQIVILSMLSNEVKFVEPKVEKVTRDEIDAI